MTDDTTHKAPSEPLSLPPAAAARGVAVNDHETAVNDRTVAITPTVAARRLGWPDSSARRWARQGRLAERLPEGWQVIEEGGRVMVLAPAEEAQAAAGGDHLAVDGGQVAVTGGQVAEAVELDRVPGVLKLMQLGPAVRGDVLLI